MTDPAQSARVRERLEMVNCAELNLAVAMIVVWSGQTEATGECWLEAYVAGGHVALTVFGSVEAALHGRVEGLQAQADSAGFGGYLAALNEWIEAMQRRVILVLDDAPRHTSAVCRQA